MRSYVIYGTDNCEYCKKAVELCKEKHMPYDYVNIFGREDLLDYFANKDWKTVPQIMWQDDMTGEHIGGYEDLVKHIEEG